MKRTPISSSLRQRTYSSNEPSLDHSPSIVRAGLSRNMAPSRRHSTEDGRSGSRPHAPPKRVAHRIDVEGRRRSSTPGISRGRRSATPTIPPQHPRVSFSRRKDGTINNQVSRYNIHDTPQESASPLLSTSRRSLRDSIDWPPPPPPLTKSVKSSEEDKKLSARPKPNIAQEILSFSAAPAPPPRPHQSRRYGTLEVEELDELKDSAPTLQPPSMRRASDGVREVRPKSTPHRRASMDWPPPPPPPLTLSAKSTDKNKNLSTIFQRNAVLEDLPFSTLPAPPSRFQEFRRQSLLTVEALDELKYPAPTPKPPNKNSRSDKESSQQPHPMYSGARSDYFLGDTAKCPTHMIIESDPGVALEKVSQLKNYDYAFIKRSDGSWTYAIVANRYHSNNDGEDFIMFVLDEAGCTKIIKKKQWANFVRCSADNLTDGSVPMNISIDFNEEDKSIISSISFY